MAGEESRFTRPGEFNIERAELLTSEGVFIDISNSIVDLIIIESIVNLSITGHIALADNLSLATFGPIIGQEYLVLKISTPSIHGSEFKIDFTRNVFHINKIETRVQAGNTTSVNVLQFTSSEIVHNQRSLVSRSLKGTYSDIVTELLRNDVNCKKSLFIEESVGLKKYIAPNVKPFDIIRTMSRQAVSVYNNSPTFVFYENIRGYHFRTLESLYASGTVFEYQEGTGGIPPNTNNTGGKGNENIRSENTLRRILSYFIPKGANTLAATTVGALSSQLLVHDITNKMVTSHNYNYFENRKDEKHINYWYGLNDGAVYNNVAIDDRGRNFSEFPCVQFLTPEAESRFDTYTPSEDVNFPYIDRQSENWLQKRRSYMTNILSSHGIVITVMGTTLVAAGDCVELHMLEKTGQSQGKDPDRFFQGPFLVHSVKHEFNIGEGIHTMELSLQKDSVASNFLNDDGHVEPKPIETGQIFSDNDFYRGGGAGR